MAPVSPVRLIIPGVAHILQLLLSLAWGFFLTASDLFFLSEDLTKRHVQKLKLKLN